MAVPSYAHANEDLLLFAALRQVPAEAGFYIDVGANDPDEGSVTKLFYEQGWRGINIEPSPEWFTRLVAARTRDVNIQAVASNAPGEVAFHDIVGEQLGTVVEEFARRHSDAGKLMRTFVVKTVTLAQLCEEHAPEDIHFLKIDVEGHEAAVLDGMDFARFRPWILVIEATEPNTRTPTHQKWDQRVRDAGYQLAFTDVLNRYYVADEHAELTSKLSGAASEYMAGRVVRLEARLDELASCVRHFEHRVSQTPGEGLASMGAFEVHDEVRGLLRLLRPHAVKGFNKARFGSPHDGGYVHLDDFRGVDTVFSLGIELNGSWDVDVAKRGMTVYQFDHTVDAPITDNARLIFARKKISTEAGPDKESLSSLVRRYDKHDALPNILLKIDIENDEWPVFDTTPPEIISRFTQIIGEFHYFEGLAEPGWRQVFSRVIKKLANYYAVVHVHANNHAGFSNIGNVVVPNVLELTFANRKIYSFSETDEIFPGPLDAPNDPRRPDMHLGSFRF